MNEEAQAIESKKYYQLGKKTYFLFVFQYSLLSFIFFVVAVILLISTVYVAYSNFLIIVNYIITACFLIWILLLVSGITAATLQYKTCSFMLDDSSFHLVRGILSREEIVIPYRWIQSVDIKQSAFSRAAKVANVIITTTQNLEEPGQVRGKIGDEVVSLMDFSLAQAVGKELTDRAEVEKMHMEK